MVSSSSFGFVCFSDSRLTKIRLSPISRHDNNFYNRGDFPRRYLSIKFPLPKIGRKRETRIARVSTIIIVVILHHHHHHHHYQVDFCPVLSSTVCAITSPRHCTEAASTFLLRVLKVPREACAFVCVCVRDRQLRPWLGRRYGPALLLYTRRHTWAGWFSACLRYRRLSALAGSKCVLPSFVFPVNYYSPNAMKKQASLACNMKTTVFCLTLVLLNCSKSIQAVHGLDGAPIPTRYP